jgi:acyl-CoA oxidase
MEEWQKAFRAKCVPYIEQLRTSDYHASAALLRQLVKDGTLKLTDLQECPEKFFRAHSILSEWSCDLGPGFGIRFTVQFNLFAGTILALGNEEQVAMLDQFQRDGTLGCFALTEKLAGVHSGMLVETTATWDESTSTFDLHSPTVGAQKNWISQGLTADKCVVVASLIVDGKNLGPHAFLMDYQQGGQLVPGVQKGDMGPKTIGNDLDNAWISFDHVKLPKEAMLNRFSDIVDGKYVQKVKNARNIDMIGQRLFTGRCLIGESGLIFTETLYSKTFDYGNNKACWAPGGNTHPLSEVPQLKDLYPEARAALSRIHRFHDVVEKELCECLRRREVPPQYLQDAIAVVKIKSIEVAIDYAQKLKQEVGSYALMAGTGFDKIDYLQTTKFAEGDSRILMQKLARDRMRAFKKNPGEGHEAEVGLCTELAGELMKDGVKAWNANQKKVYALADRVCERTIDTWMDHAKL